MRLVVYSTHTPTTMLRLTKALIAAAPLALFPLQPKIATPAPRTLDGYVIAMNIGMQMKEMTAPMGMTIKLAGDKMRFEMDMAAMMASMSGGQASDESAMMNGAYMLAQGDGRIAVVLPNFKNPMSGGTGWGMVMSGDMLANQAKQSGATTGLPGDFTVTLNDIGPGEAILGHPTRHYKMTFESKGSSSPDNGVVELWMATDMNDIAAGYKKFGEAFGNSFFSGGSEKKGDAIADKMPAGLPLRMTVSGTSTNGSEMMKMEVTKAEKSKFDDKDFEVPAGIQLMDMSGLMKR